MTAARNLEALPDIVMTDIDGVWTDGGMYYSSQHHELKKFNTSDSAGVLFLRYLGIPLAIITGENTEIVAARAAKLGVEHVFQGVSDKLSVAQAFCEERDSSLDKVAYIGDDLNDMALLGAVGWSGCPANAPSYVQQYVDVVTQRRGGEGAFREFVEDILLRTGKLDDAVAAVSGVS